MLLWASSGLDNAESSTRVCTEPSCVLCQRATAVVPTFLHAGCKNWAEKPPIRPIRRGVLGYFQMLWGAKMILSPSVLQQRHLLLSHLELKIKAWGFTCSQSFPSIPCGQLLTRRTTVASEWRRCSDGFSVSIRVCFSLWEERGG